ncbi:MAG: hypothetical protein M1294_01505 [Firmicutes bacterium]|nr:hypothetical protein [Bacillota bacterium]MCL5014466.1 hypothetical protein [Bacillota bacterium]
MKKFQLYWTDRPGEYHWVRNGNQVHPSTRDVSQYWTIFVAPFWRNKP